MFVFGSSAINEDFTIGFRLCSGQKTEVLQFSLFIFLVFFRVEALLQIQEYAKSGIIPSNKQEISLC